MDDNILYVTGFIMGMAPAVSITWIVIAKYAMEMFQSADIQAISEKANPALVPGTSTQQSTQTK